MRKDTEKIKPQSLPIPYTQEVKDNLNRIQATLQLRDGRRTSLKRIAVDILSSAKAAEFKYEIGQQVWYRTNGEDPEQFEIEERKFINSHPCYLVDGKFVHEEFLKP